jgi:sulfite exporter TauE/SafE
VTAGVLAALATGLLGSLGHCLGMCGPIAGAVCAAGAAEGPLVALPGAGGAAAVRTTARRALLVGLAYNAGRVTTYGLVGFAMGLTGSFVNTAARLAGLQDAVSVVAGALMVALGLGALGLAGAARRLEGRLTERVFRAARALLEGGGPARSYPLGRALGLRPGGRSYSAVRAAAATGSPASGLAVALAFGVGTTPALLAAGVLAGAIGPRLRGALYRVAGALVVLFGLGFVLRGLGFHAAL